MCTATKPADYASFTNYGMLFLPIAEVVLELRDISNGVTNTLGKFIHFKPLKDLPLKILFIANTQIKKLNAPIGAFSSLFIRHFQDDQNGLFFIILFSGHHVFLDF
ncbi:hypothetical protein CON65_23590 [Bacillus pseudomycoides]|uniref:Uncharacterized protein n=1 Tax=Bacillus pseudomycoides TaxID=64104 RepID=A0AA91ZRA7_9BACI|nr:hypothetical protein COO03_25350 [Bacillus sp. AFS098217]PED80262.1 hypothetical protein CON65_23590 [Bacillus pseudomycoides]PEU11705.1 hypothetical protein CN524_14390 [Bacillus sp. AFS019443]PEU17910.1 hypothetical protein CN525_13610 [Bacillus sp. AFS014408]PFW62584.1 hypothetical protein COL20_12330 [Bacillus sp. AFS075034]